MQRNRSLPLSHGDGAGGVPHADIAVRRARLPRRPAPSRASHGSHKGLGMDHSNDIAIVAVACRFAGAPDPDAFWRNLRDGVESVRRYSPAELLEMGVLEEHLRDPKF